MNTEMQVKELEYELLEFLAPCLTEFTTLVDQCFHVIITNE